MQFELLIHKNIKELKMTTAKRQRIRVCLRSYEHKLVDVSAEKIVETAKAALEKAAA